MVGGLGQADVNRRTDDFQKAVCLSTGIDWREGRRGRGGCGNGMDGIQGVDLSDVRQSGQSMMFHFPRTSRDPFAPCEN